MSIEWIKSAVCYADGHQWLMNDDGNCMVPPRVLGYKDFQLNTIKQGDYIEASELDTEQKYNDAVEVFGLFGFNLEAETAWSYARRSEFVALACCDDGLWQATSGRWSERKLTYPQLMAIGEFKRLELEKSAPKIAPDLTPDLASKQEVKMQKNKPVVAQVMIDLTERMEMGIKTYGEALRANNGRDALQDAYEEALDLACYLKQAMIERDNANTN